MKVCLILEGSYPYIAGGVSSWIHNFIQSFPQVEFVIQTIISNREQSGKFIYELPKNVTEVQELYLQDLDWDLNKKKKVKLTQTQKNALRGLVMGQKIDWNTLFGLFYKSSISLDRFLMGEDFLNVIQEYYDQNYSELVFSDFLWTMRSIYLPLLLTLKMNLPRADIYHCLSAGYSGVLGAMGQFIHGGKLLLSEHGIYTREREEEMIRADWAKGTFKTIWIEQFHKMSQLAYERADLVTSLYEHSRNLQIELGCPPQKTKIIPNGIDVERLTNLTGKREEDLSRFNIGAIARVTPIKDIKTMIQAFNFAKEKEPRLKLWIMGPMDEDPQYAKECQEQVIALGLQDDIVFTGTININDYLGRMDVTILSSISEGQPLTILESFAAHVPVIATDVGNCAGLIYGEADTFGAAGIVTPIMNIEKMAQAMIDLAHNPFKCKEMGENGYKRVISQYRLDQMHSRYQELYQSLSLK